MTPISLHLPENWYSLHYPVTDSTMLRLRDDILQQRPEEFILATTDFQTAGRGQKGTSWEADAGANLLFGFSFHPQHISACRQFALSEILALSVAGALTQYTEDISIKWPNDIYWKDRKICGMLLEHDLCGDHIQTTLTGVGININQTVFRSDAPNPVSLLQIVGHEVDRSEILELILLQFTTYYYGLQQGLYAEIHEMYMERLYRRRGLHEYRDAEGLFRAEIIDISPLGILTLRRDSGRTDHYAFKEISYVL